MRNLIAAVVCLACTILPPNLALASQFDGQWVINLTETDKVAVKYKDGSGVQGNASRFRPTIDVGLGLPLPQRFKQAPMSNLSPKDPHVLRCNKMVITTDGKKTKLVYDQGEQETLRTGHYRGRDTSKSKDRIQQKYKTPDRKVTKTWSIRPDGRLLVAVKLNPPKDKSRTYKRVFDRLDANAVGSTAHAGANTQNPVN